MQLPGNVLPADAQMHPRRKIVDSLMVDGIGFEPRHNVSLQVADTDHDNDFALAIFQKVKILIVDADFPLRS